MDQSSLSCPAFVLASFCLLASVLVVSGGHICGPNQSWASTKCDDLYCSNDNNQRECNFVHPWLGCWCKTGFRRNQNYDCVRESQCFESCPDNERPVRDSSYCEYNCNSIKCNMMKKKPCTCLPGFYRNTVTNACVKSDECPPEQEEVPTPLDD